MQAERKDVCQLKQTAFLISQTVYMHGFTAIRQDIWSRMAVCFWNKFWILHNTLLWFLYPLLFRKTGCDALQGSCIGSNFSLLETFTCRQNQTNRLLNFRKLIFSLEALSFWYVYNSLDLKMEVSLGTCTMYSQICSMSIGGFYRNALGWSLLCIGNAFS
jgi:hypothetical protein